MTSLIRVLYAWLYQVSRILNNRADVCIQKILPAISFEERGLPVLIGKN